MYRIYDETALQRRLHLRRLQVFAIFACGVGSGLWLSASAPQQAMAAMPPVDARITQAPAPLGCAPALAAATRLHLDCELKSLRR